MIFVGQADNRLHDLAALKIRMASHRRQAERRREPNTAGASASAGIPTILIFKGGEIVESVVGLTDKDHLKQLLDKHA